MNKILFFTLLFFQSVYGDQELEKYFTYQKMLGEPKGNYQKGEIEIVLDTSDILRIQQIQENRLIQKGIPKDAAQHFSRVGIVSEDQYWVWLRDAVYFPQGISGTYDRLLWKSELKKKGAGVAVLPILPSGRIVLILNYRHATRSWELELPRGGVKFEETQEEAAFRELKEETGYIATSVKLLGMIATDSGVISSINSVFIAEILTAGESASEYSEAISGVFDFSKEELKTALIQGFLELTVGGEKMQVPVRDAFLTYALYQADIQGFKF